jgi:hypothetical protein
VIEMFQEDPGLKWVECAACKNLECAANLDACFLCTDPPDLCHDCLETHTEQNHTKEEARQFFAD